MSDFQMKPFFPPEIEAAWLAFAENLREHIIAQGSDQRYADFLVGVDRFCDEINTDYDKRGKIQDYFYGIWRVVTDNMNVDPESPMMDPF